ncbi:MAG TPA: hypothetical protein VJ571_04445 [Candidatus Nitrosotalea sp.]|nr:hypothetical protein [Candidatus Nitrosotalea sp.]
MPAEVPERASDTGPEGGPIVLSPENRIPDDCPPKPERHRATDDEIERRRIDILLLREDIYRSGKVPKQWNLLEGLRKKGYDIDRKTLQRDLLVIDNDNKFVVNLATVNYNRIIEDMFDHIDFVIEGCDDVIDRKWTQSKIITTDVIDEGGATRTVQKVVTDELAAPRLKAYEIKMTAMKLLADIFKGGIVDAGIALAQRDANVMKHDMQKLRLLIKQKDDLIAELKSHVQKAKQ